MKSVPSSAVWETLHRLLGALSEAGKGCAILVNEEFSCLEFDMNRDAISWIRRKIEYRRSLMEHLPKKTCQNGISYTLVGDYYIPDLQLAGSPFRARHRHTLPSVSA